MHAGKHAPHSAYGVQAELAVMNDGQSAAAHASGSGASRQPLFTMQAWSARHAGVCWHSASWLTHPVEPKLATQSPHG